MNPGCVNLPSEAEILATLDRLSDTAADQPEYKGKYKGTGTNGP